MMSPGPLEDQHLAALPNAILIRTRADRRQRDQRGQRVCVFHSRVRASLGYLDSLIFLSLVLFSLFFGDLYRGRIVRSARTGRIGSTAPARVVLRPPLRLLRARVHLKIAINARKT